MDLSIARPVRVAFAVAPGDVERAAILAAPVVPAAEFGDGVDANMHILDLGARIGG